MLKVLFIYYIINFFIVVVVLFYLLVLNLIFQFLDKEKKKVKVGVINVFYEILLGESSQLC